MFWPLMKSTITDKDKSKLIKFIKESDRFTNGEKVIEFEKKWSNWLGINHSLFVSSGSTANFLLLSSIKEKYNLNNDDKVIVPACTWMTNVAPVIQIGFKPIFCDINLQNYSFDKEYLLKIKNKENDIKIVFVTHLLGIPADIEYYKNIFPNAIFLEDVCESHGSMIGNKKTGTFSNGSTFSFYYGHHMSCIEGGMVCTNDSELYYLMKSKRSHGYAKELDKNLFEKIRNEYNDMNPDFLFYTDGYNFRNTELGAVLGLSQLENLDKNNIKRKNNFKKFINIIKKYDIFEIPSEEGNSSFCFPFIIKDINFKNKLLKIFKNNGIETRPIVGGNLVRQPFLKKLNINNDFHNADYLNDNGFYIGNNHLIKNNEIKELSYIIDIAYKEFVNG